MERGWFRHLLAAAALTTALPGAAAATHLDGFVFTFPTVPASQSFGPWVYAGSASSHQRTASWSGNYMGNFHEETVRLTGIDYLSIESIPRGTGYLSFDLLLKGFWGGNGGTSSTPYDDYESFFKVVANGRTLLDATFASFFSWDQSYPGSFPQDSHPAGTGSVFRSASEDLTVYRFLNLTFPISLPPCCADVTIQFSASFGAAYDDPEIPTPKGDWGLDNVVVSSRAIPEPSTGALVGLGLGVLAARRRFAARL